LSLYVRSVEGVSRCGQARSLPGGILSQLAGKKKEAEIRRYPTDDKQQYKDESKLYDSLPL
jgi:hypothetical protein